MEITQIRYFLEVARTQHITKSAEKLHIVQPALSQSIKRLEESVGVPLFENQGRNIVLTEYGRYLQEELQPIMDRLERLPDELQEMARLREKTVILKVSAASTLVTESIIEYRHLHPHVNFRIIQGQEGGCDIEVSTKLFFQKGLGDGDDVFVCPEQIFLAVPASGRFGFADTITLKDVENEDFISLAGSKTFRDICDVFCQHAGIWPNIVFESDSPVAVRNMIAANIGVGFWPEFTWGGLDRNNIRLLRITDPMCSRDLIIRRSPTTKRSDEVDDYFAFLRSFCLASKERVV